MNGALVAVIVFGDMSTEYRYGRQRTQIPPTA
jgi:hypothetical protein